MPIIFFLFLLISPSSFCLNDLSSLTIEIPSNPVLLVADNSTDGTGTIVSSDSGIVDLSAPGSDPMPLVPPSFGSSPFPPNPNLSPAVAPDGHNGHPHLDEIGQEGLATWTSDGAYPYAMYGPMGAYGIPFLDDSCWGPCKQTIFENTWASGTPTAIKPEPIEDEGNTITTTTLLALIKSKVEMVLIDARLGGLDDGKRIPGARILGENPTIEEVEKFAAPRGTLIVVYGDEKSSTIVRNLAKRLKRFGYENVIEYKDGIQGWLSSGQAVIQATDK